MPIIILFFQAMQNPTKFFYENYSFRSSFQSQYILRTICPWTRILFCFWQHLRRRNPLFYPKVVPSHPSLLPSSHLIYIKSFWSSFQSQYILTTTCPWTHILFCFWQHLRRRNSLFYPKLFLLIDRCSHPVTSFILNNMKVNILQYLIDNHTWGEPSHDGIFLVIEMYVDWKHPF